MKSVAGDANACRLSGACKVWFRCTTVITECLGLSLFSGYTTEALFEYVVLRRHCCIRLILFVTVLEN